MIIHKKQICENVTMYYFTKSKSQCLRVEYDKREDYGRHSTSSTDLKINIHFQNSWVKDKLTEIKIEEVPQAITDVLRYLEVKSSRRIKPKKYAFLLMAALTLGCNGVEPEVNIEVGQVWKQVLHSDNPYRKAMIDYKEVIEITGDYVLYVQNDKDTLHEKKYWFRICSECINCKN